MNSKNCRELRQQIKQKIFEQHDIKIKGGLPREYDVTEVRTPCLIQVEGKWVKDIALTYVKTLQENCAREIYQKIKRNYNKGVYKL